MQAIKIKQERLSAEEYIEFLKRTDLGSQYPRERFRERIEKLVNSVPVSLTARTRDGKLVGACFGITDFAYWLFITDLGVDRDYVKQGIGGELLRQAHELAGGKKDIILYTCVNSNAIPFYQKQGMVFSTDIMELNQIDWTSFTVE